MVAFHTVREFFLELFTRPRCGLIAKLCLDGVVEVLVGVKFGAIGREVEKLNLSLVFGDPFLNLICVMHPEVIEDKEHFGVRITDDALQKLDKNGDLQAFKPLWYTINRSLPRLVTEDIILTENLAAWVPATGAWPWGAYPRPRLSSLLRPVSSHH